MNTHPRELVALGLVLTAVGVLMGGAPVVAIGVVLVLVGVVWWLLHGISRPGDARLEPDAEAQRLRD